MFNVESVEVVSLIEKFQITYWEDSEEPRDEEDMDDCDGFWSDLFDLIEETFNIELTDEQKEDVENL